MRRGGFYAAWGTGALVFAVAIVALATRPAVRALAGSFFAPLPPAPSLSRDAGVAGLPIEPISLGAESPELVALRSGDAGAPTPRGPRRTLFGTDLVAAGVAPSHRPDGLRRSALSTRDDPGAGATLAYLTHDERGHGTLLAAIKRGGRSRSDVERILRAWKVPEDLVAVIFVESAFSPTSTPSDGGDGLWGLSTDVAAAYGLEVLPSFDERRSVAVSTEGAAHYLADLRERLGSWELALYAFGAGYAPALLDLSKRAQDDFWSLAPELPVDRVAYVRQVLAVATVLANLDRFGFEDARPDEPLASSDLEVPAGASFGTVARAAGTSAARLRELNPEYLGETVPNTGFAMVMHLPSAGLARAKEMLIPLLYATPGSSLSRALPTRSGDAAASPERPTRAVARSHKGRFFYRTQDGDTLESLASRFGTDKQTIALDNALDPSAGLAPGQLLTIRPPNEGDSDHPAP